MNANLKIGMEVTVNGAIGKVEAIHDSYIVLNGGDFSGYSKIDRTVSISDITTEAPATEKQIEYLRKLGVSISGISKSYASVLIDAAKTDNLGSYNVFKTDGTN